MGLVKPYEDYTYLKDGLDNGQQSRPTSNQVRETVKRILTLSKNKNKLRQERADAAALRKKLSVGLSIKQELFKSNGSTRRMVVDEDAFFDQQETKAINNKQNPETEMKEKEEPKKTSYDKMGEPNLARKLGLEPETDEAIVKKTDSKKKSKEDLEKEVAASDGESDRRGQEHHIRRRRAVQEPGPVHEGNRPARYRPDAAPDRQQSAHERRPRQ